jgi:hypothetical protein
MLLVQSAADVEAASYSMQQAGLAAASDRVVGWLAGFSGMEPLDAGLPALQHLWQTAASTLGLQLCSTRMSTRGKASTLHVTLPLGTAGGSC